MEAVPIDELKAGDHIVFNNKTYSIDWIGKNSSSEFTVVASRLDDALAMISVSFHIGKAR